MPELVIDNSIMVAWCFPDEKSSYANRVLRSLATDTAIVPALWTFEAANVFLVGERRKRSTETDTSAWTQFLSTLPITIDNRNIAQLFKNILSVARIHNL